MCGQTGIFAVSENWNLTGGGNMKIDFDKNNQPIKPTLILSERNGNKIGILVTEDTLIQDCFNTCPEFAITVHKEMCNSIWDRIENFKLAWYKEQDVWFEITVSINEEDGTIKNVNGKRLGEAELSQIMLYDIEINTEDDINRDDYEIPTVLYNPEHPEASLLDRMMEKAYHYRVAHVDDTIKNIQRVFSFNEISIYDAFQEVAQELDCLFCFDSHSDINGKIDRTVSVYDLESNCLNCGNRGIFVSKCPKCSSLNISSGYGKDTTIFITADELADSIDFETDTDAVKNCFKLEAGDELMTATIRNLNPNGTDYIYYYSDEMKKSMPKELVDEIERYNQEYTWWCEEYDIFANDDVALDNYVNVVNKYKQIDESISDLEQPLLGYSGLSKAYYHTVNFKLLLQSELMPSSELPTTSAENEFQKILNYMSISDNRSTICEKLGTLTLEKACDSFLTYAKSVIDSRYEVTVDFEQGTEDTKTQLYTVDETEYWYQRENGRLLEVLFKVKDLYSDDYCDSMNYLTGGIAVCHLMFYEIFKTKEAYKNYAEEQINIVLKKNSTGEIDVKRLFNKSVNELTAELKYYCLDSLNNFAEVCQACLDIMVKQGVSNKETWGNTSSSGTNIYDLLYLPYLEKQIAINNEIKSRKTDIDIIDKFQKDITNKQNHISWWINNGYFQGDLKDLLNLYRREDKYVNSNYVSDGLTDSEIFKKAEEFLETAQKELYKSAVMQHAISADMNTLIATPKFSPVIDYFEVGNWLRVEIDEKIYKLRLLEYQLKYSSDEVVELNVTFSDVNKNNNEITDIQNVLSQAQSMATTYSSVKRQSEQGYQGNQQINSWFEDGININTYNILNAENQTQSWDSNGMLFKEYLPDMSGYADTQLKIINSTLAITTDAWVTTKTAIGQVYYIDPKDRENIKYAYGVNAETIIGKLIIGEQLTMSNTDNSMNFDEDGLTVTNGTNTVSINPNDDNSIFKITKGNNNILNFDNNGDLNITGNIVAKNITLSSAATSAITNAVINELSTSQTTSNTTSLKKNNALKTLSIETIEPTNSNISPTRIECSQNSMIIKPNILYVWGETSELNITLDTITNYSVINKYIFVFISGNTSTVLNIDGDVVFENLNIEPNRKYKIEIVEGIGVVNSIPYQNQR